MSGQLSLPLLAALAAVCLWILCDEGQVEARRNVQKYERDYPTKFWASGLRTIREPLGERSNLDRARAVVGLRAAISAMLEEIENREMNSTSGSSSNDQEGQPVYSSKRSGQRSFGGASRLNYLISPISNQILLNDERDLANSVGDSLSEKYNTVWRSLHQGRAEDSIECRTIRSSIELSRDDVDKTSGQLVRNCKGAVALNRCEGSCSSSVLPSIKSRNGFKKVNFSPDRNKG